MTAAFTDVPAMPTLALIESPYRSCDVSRAAGTRG